MDLYPSMSLAREAGSQVMQRNAGTLYLYSCFFDNDDVVMLFKFVSLASLGGLVVVFFWYPGSVSQKHQAGLDLG